MRTVLQQIYTHINIHTHNHTHIHKDVRKVLNSRMYFSAFISFWLNCLCKGDGGLTDRRHLRILFYFTFCCQVLLVTLLPERSNLLSLLTIECKGAAAVAQLVERLLPTTEMHSSNPVISVFCVTYEELPLKRWTIFLKWAIPGLF